VLGDGRCSAYPFDYKAEDDEDSDDFDFDVG
jgi:hypothetical protein